MSKRNLTPRQREKACLILELDAPETSRRDGSSCRRGVGSSFPDLQSILQSLAPARIRTYFQAERVYAQEGRQGSQGVKAQLRRERPFRTEAVLATKTVGIFHRPLSRLRTCNTLTARRGSSIYIQFVLPSIAEYC